MVFIFFIIIVVKVSLEIEMVLSNKAIISQNSLKFVNVGFLSWEVFKKSCQRYKTYEHNQQPHNNMTQSQNSWSLWFQLTNSKEHLTKYCYLLQLRLATAGSYIYYLFNYLSFNHSLIHCPISAYYIMRSNNDNSLEYSLIVLVCW